MLTDILFLIVFKLISAPTWCFVVTWILFGIDALVSLTKAYKFIYEKGKKDGNKSNWSNGYLR